MAETEKYYEQGIPQTKQNERFVPDVYMYQGVPHVGYGFNLTDKNMRSLIDPAIIAGQRKMTRDEADKIFMVKYNQAARDAFNFTGSDAMLNLTPKQQAVLVDMSYNLGGPRLNTFVEMQKAIRAGDIQRAASEMKDSKWYNQVGDRGKRNVLTFGGK